MFETESFSCSSKDSNKPSQDKNEWITTRQCSCAFVNTPLPCINKAIHHIQELELKVEKCFQQSDCVFKEDKIPWTTKQVSAESIQDIWLSLSTKLDFKEADVCCEDGKTLTLKQETEALLLEVTELIRRLEADCEEAEKALELEKQRRKKLGMKIDCMSLWRLQQLPAAVQKEYQMCAQDILELQWHIDCKSRQLRQVQNQILKIETVNRKIQEDIDFMKKHSPLLEEKLNLESEAVKDVLLAYEKTSKIYGDVHCELMEIQKTMKSIDEESEKKIKSMYEKITYAEVLLSQYMNELKHSEFIWTEYCMKLKETEKKIIKDEKHLEELVKQKAEIQEDAKCWNSKTEDLNNKIAAQGDESVKISDASSEVIKAVEELKSTRKSDLQNIKQKFLNLNEALDISKCANEELEGENKEFLQKFGNSSRKKNAYQSEVESICENMCKIEQQIERLDEDLCKAELSYSEKKRKYEDLKKNKTAEEISFKNSEWNLKKEIQDQKGVWKVIQTRIKAIYEELEKKKKDRLKKREEDMKRIEEIERQVADLETKLKINKDILQDNHEKLSYLDQREQELYKQQKRTEQQLEQKRSIMQQQLNDIQEKISFVSSQIFENFHTMEKFKNELKELNELWNIKQIQMENTEKSFIDLRKNLSGVMFKQQNVQMIFNHLQDELAEYEKRLKQEEKTYGELLQIRKENLKDLEAALEQIIKENLWLAQEYQIFQNYYLNSKEDLTELYANRIRVEAAIRDHQQGELSKAIQHITTFLRSLTDGSPTTDNNANNQCILDAEIKDKKSHTVQITV
ncbi:coiled-coil domain-containing protein 178 isoform X2 [Balearica regulorum gibbericeps]|uniref:coiled-coil domain-containing protein 178 isoform X2 n=1 Tax=Balearica regulorum gibbericeps TaxID=100784 RepID=UPI003F63182C